MKKLVNGQFLVANTVSFLRKKAFVQPKMVSHKVSLTTTRPFNWLLMSTLGVSALLFSSLTQAAETTISVDLAGANATKHEIALLQVLSEVCPPMLSTQQRGNFYKSYNHELHELLPTISDPKAAIHYLSTQQDYKTILSSMRTWTMGYSHDDNLALCTDLANEPL